VLERWGKLNRAARERVRRRCRGARSGLLARVAELHKRDVLHLHVLVGYEKPGIEREAGEAYVEALHVLAPKYGFGEQFDGGYWKSAGSAESISYIVKSAAYLSKPGGLKERYEHLPGCLSPRLPGRVAYTARRVTDDTGITMRAVRRRGCVYGESSVTVPFWPGLLEWREYERALKRPLTTRELKSAVWGPP